ncbi:hypothetical protein [Desulfobacter vibrioformis]|uniref:hypothetical protein n=1 Tax=Desulfobacter vibrioformis TaxID=34031 RepID=UPI00054EC85E|nr:hypothetical protein [Desulfobacter vibrioformis]
MSKRKEKIDPNQMEFDWEFPSKLEKVLEERRQLKEKIVTGPPKPRATENEFGLCVALAAAIKKAIDDANLSREQLVDGVNCYFGRTAEDAEKKEDMICRNPLTIHMLNNYLSKPAETPIPAYYLFAIHHITKSLEPARAFVEAEGAKIATGSEIRQMALGKLEEHIVEINKLKKELKCRP